MLDPVKLGRLRQDRRAAVFRQKINGPTQSRIGRQPGKPIRSATLQPDLDVLGGNLLPRGAVGLVQHPADRRLAVFHRRQSAANALHPHLPQHGAGLQGGGFEKRLKIVPLTAQATDQGTGDIGVLDVTLQGPPQKLDRLARLLHPAALLRG